MTPIIRRAPAPRFEMQRVNPRCFWRWLAATGLAVILPISASADTLNFQVTTTEDVLDYVCPTTNLPGDHCSLRDAIWAANINAGPDAITLPAGTFHLTIAGAYDDTAVTGDLDITDSVIIVGQGPGATIIDATGLEDRVFDIRSSASNVGLANLTITGGYFPWGQGGGIYHCGGELVLSNVRLEGNTSGAGGGISAFSAGMLIVQDGSVIIGNYGSAAGGGIRVADTDFSVTNSTITANTTDFCGGGIHAWISNGDIAFSTISYNTATADSDSGGGGGGLCVEDAGGAESVDVGNSTIAGNMTNGKGGALYVSDSGAVSLLNVTIDKNLADQNIVVYNEGSMEVANTVIIDYCDTGGVGSFTTMGGNVESPLDTCGFGEAPNDLVGVTDPKLGPLGAFGGPTATILPLIGSPVIGNNYGSCPTYDQRGFLRSDGDCDSGAVERRPTDPNPLFVDDFESGVTMAWSGFVE